MSMPRLFLLCCVALLPACEQDTLARQPLPAVAPEARVAITSERITNVEAPVPPQCYTRTEDRHNPCYTCHQAYDRKHGEPRMNQLDDGGLQGGYLFSEEGETNHWRNLFVDRRDWLAQISDEQILEWVNQDNYSDLADRLREIDWPGYVPDLADYQHGADAFDDQGFARDNSGWVAFNYKPFPGTFWPTNGSTDDVLIRLPEPFRTLNGTEDRAVYLLNLTLVELVIKNDTRTSIPPTDETRLNVDLDGDGKLATAVSLVRGTHYLGDASDTALAFQQYPAGTEMLHSVRYLGIGEDDRIGVSTRMKELRYMRKQVQLPDYDIASRYARERKEKLLGELPSFVHLPAQGMENGMGWLLQGYIEDYDGALRPQSFEETLHCMGCHAAVGATIDQTFAFARKVPGADGWGYIDTRGMPDTPNRNEPGGEIRNYLARAGGGSEFRENPEMLARWYREDGNVDDDKLASADVYNLITPSRERALKLNKAYTHTVRHQSYIYGRDATWLPAKNVFEHIDQSQPPLAPEFRFYGWDLRLDRPTDTPSPAKGRAGEGSTAAKHPLAVK